MKMQNGVARGRLLTLLWVMNLALAGLLPRAQAAGTTFSGSQLIGQGYYSKLADMDNDGDLDVVALKRVNLVGGPIYSPIWLENQGTTFTEHLIIDWQCATIHMEPADLDGDGDMDLILGSLGIFKYTAGIALTAWLENDGSKPPRFTPHSLFDSPANYAKRSLGVADLDNDGDLDVVAAFSSHLITDKGLVLWYENDGGRPPRFTSHILADTGEPVIRDLAVADATGDGRLDVLMGTTGLGTLLFQNMGSKTQPFRPLPVTHIAGQIRTADLNGDGRLDVLTGYTWQENRGGDPTTFTTHLLSPDFKLINYHCGEVAVGDLDRDGDMDPVSYDPYNQTSYGQNLCWFQNDGKAAPAFTLAVLGAEHLMPQVGDLTGDGNPDIVCATSNYQLYSYRNQAALQPVTVLSPTEAGRAYASGNKIDIFWRTDTKKAGTAVTLELWQGNKKVAGLGSSFNAQGRGHAQVTLPLVFSGGGYRIKAASSYAPTLYWDFSDEPFVIKGKANGVKPAEWAYYP